jgi:signal transduction histidine kinase
LIERLRLSFRSELRGRRLDLVVEGDTDVEVLTEPVVLCVHVIGNLVSNAIKYSMSPGQVVVRIEANDATVRISVSNVAAADDARALRERLEGKREAAPSERGQGIGLAIVRRFCDVLGYPLEARVDANGHVAVVMTVTVPRVIGASITPGSADRRTSLPAV